MPSDNVEQLDEHRREIVHVLELLLESAKKGEINTLFYVEVSADANREEQYELLGYPDPDGFVRAAQEKWYREWLYDWVLDRMEENTEQEDDSA